MFSRILFSKPLSQATTTRAFFSTNVAPRSSYSKYKKLAWITAGVSVTGGALYYLAKDTERVFKSLEPEEHPPSLALQPERGGSRLLPVSRYYLDDTVEKENTKPRLVIIGSGWGAISILKNLEKDKYNVTVISENNYFLFTPLLPSATVGTLELRQVIFTIFRCFFLKKKN